jgi:hypothetical protein
MGNETPAQTRKASTADIVNSIIDRFVGSNSGYIAQ